MKKKIAILGSTGSIGKQTLELINKDKKNFDVVLLSTNENIREISKQVKLFNPKYLIITDFKKFHFFREKNKKIKIFNNYNCFKKVFSKKVDYVMSSISGFEGLQPTIEIIKHTKLIAIANKESVICGWSLINNELKKNKTKFIPVDSEHFSIFSLLKSDETDKIKMIYITASGGPFINIPKYKLKKIKTKDALKHPNWNMGRKISIDSATLMNKMLEVIEAHKLFSIELKKIDIVIHPESLVHAIIEFKNGLCKFIYHETTMLIPLANAIFGKDVDINDYLKPKKNNKNSISFQNLNFLKVEKKRFPIIKLKNRINEYISTPIIINAANEILVDQYLKEKISFNTFYKYLTQVLNDRNYKKYAIKEPKNIDQIFQVDKWSRSTVYKKINYKNA